MSSHATGSAGTQAGFAASLVGMNSGVRLLGIGVRAHRPQQESNVYALACATADKLGLRTCIERSDIEANCDYVGAGYGVPGADTLEAIRLLARTEGILLDPVYSGKGMAGLIDLCWRDVFTRDEDVVFVHSGGSAALFAYTERFIENPA